MTIWFQVVLVVVSVSTCAFILKNIRKSQVQITDAIFWVFFSLILLIFSIYPQLAESLSRALGIVSSVNFIFLFIIFLLLINQFQLTIRLSKLDSKFKDLVQVIALRSRIHEEEE
ncbi:DUF2304 domain-containing protein [Streptococcus acidominimus]|uniref:Glycosyl transferase n=1 Tax=Streptococcus acidominimus TaxID=1326 RepID=A0A1Q8EE38_STRAI|nr:DUF2304 domain-containing protein [Streptococcus acidominimus]OLF50064.1 glycosyl transferase [Streptococcus acidominimus]SUN08068.1 membrane protein [Streptococcus acidominimus]